MNRVLITGTNGFIGKHLYDKYIQDGKNVTGWGRRELNPIDAEWLATLHPDLIIHCAGSASVYKSILNPMQDYQDNVTLTYHLLEAVRAAKLCSSRVIFLSSAAVYGNPKKLPITEEAERSPLSPYALHKTMCEDICNFMIHNYGMNVKIARIFSAYGPGLHKQIFWDMYQKATKYGKLELFGTGNESRDFIYIDDLVSAIQLIANMPEEERSVINIANGVEVSIQKAAGLFAKEMEIDTDHIVFDQVERQGDPLNWKADISVLKKLGYQPTYDLQEGLHRYICSLRRV